MPSNSSVEEGFNVLNTIKIKGTNAVDGLQFLLSRIRGYTVLPIEGHLYICIYVRSSVKIMKAGSSIQLGKIVSCTPEEICGTLTYRYMCAHRPVMENRQGCAWSVFVSIKYGVHKGV